MRVLFCKIHCPSFICFCKPSAHIYTPGPLKLENIPHPHVPSKLVSVPEASDQLAGEAKLTEETLDHEKQQQPTLNCRKSSLKKPNSSSGSPNEEQKKRVQWMDFLGKELVSIREFESSEGEESDNEDGQNRGCICVIL
ncbi:uncharacterized protein LOC107415059 [Ziziphus jujuba]|uniref:Uncharacterized protein LOC107415059 n=1 Tax=Ziziphus jujuba TaxID=326968 RepID=A0A6P3ZJZ5_ZIZJJ|nr:uncharacterized protein LOC107415059 [Ziziphus jujuba]